MGEMKLFLLILLLSVQTNVFSQNEIVYKAVKTVKFSKSSTAELKIYKDKNNYLFRVFEKGMLHDEISLLNIDYSDIDIKKVYFQKSEEVFITEFGIFGSTYDANKFLIIYQADGLWHFISPAFPRSELVKTNKENFYKLKVLKGNFNGSCFSFSKGNFKQLK